MPATSGGSKRMTEPKKTRLKGRKPPEGSKRQFLVTMGPETIKAIKTAAIALDKTASELMEDAAKEWLERRDKKSAGS
jgi:hypothetical protein